MASCKDCVHVEVCSKKNLHVAVGMNITPRFKYKRIEQECERFKDRARFVELPCKVGDDVYCIYHGKIERSGVTSICIGSHYTGIVIYTVQFSFTAENIGKFIFFSVEEAEQALKERENNGHGNDDLGSY